MTFSIVARDGASGELGVAVASRSFNLSWLCGWPAAGVGAIATQANTNPNFGPSGLELLRSGATAEDVVSALLAGDGQTERRQLAVVDSSGGASAHTGRACAHHAAHHVGLGYAVQGNILATDAVVPDMAAAFEGTAAPLARRMLTSMVAGQAAGGDARGRQSAVLLTVSGNSSEPAWRRLTDFQIADHPDPLGEIGRLLDLQDRLQQSGRGIAAVLDGRIEDALDELEPMEDDVPEVVFNRVLAFFAAGRRDDATAEARRLFTIAPSWRGLPLYADLVPGAAAFLDSLAH
jgi:uncharacterized Ntn-hydrolase superfamily protein